MIPAVSRWNSGHTLDSSIFYLPYFGKDSIHTYLTRGLNDLISRQRAIPTNCHGWRRNGDGAAEFISHESITAEVTTDILRLKAETASPDV